MPARILIADDMLSMRMLLKTILRGHDVIVEEATNGREAVEKALATPPPDLVMLDVMMPELTGIQSCQMIKEKHKDLPVIMMTTKGEDKFIEAAKAAGADDYLTKPVVPQDLLNAIRKHLKR